MRNIAFSHTTPQFLAGTKDVTRRVGWANLQPGTWLMAVEKSQGLRKGEKVRRLGPIVVVSVRRESIAAITQEDMPREGFPDATAAEFVHWWTGGRVGALREMVTRIEFRRVAEHCRRLSNGCCGWMRCPYLAEGPSIGRDCPLLFNNQETQ